MAEAPWIKFYAEDFLQGVSASNLTAEETGVYIVILSLIATRGAPVEDDRRWLAGRANVSTRRLNQIVDRLIGLGKLEKRGDLLGNKRMVAEVGRRDERSRSATKAAMTRWHGGPDEPEQPLYPEIKPGLSPDNPGNNGAKPEQKREKTAIPDDANAPSPTRARASEPQRLRDNGGCTKTPTVEAETTPDPRDWVNRCGQAAGVAVFPNRPQHFADQLLAVGRWIALGLDPEADILPLLRRDAEKTEQPRYSLAYFDPIMAKAAARKDLPVDRPADPADHSSPLVRAALRAAASGGG